MAMAAIDVDLAGIPAKFLTVHGAGLGGEGFIGIWIRSRSEAFQPAFWQSASLEMGMGPCAHHLVVDAAPGPSCTMRAQRGKAPRALARPWRSSAPARRRRSLRPEALPPAVTLPSLAKAGLRPAMASMVAPSRIYSSVSTTVSPLRVLTRHGGNFILELAGLAAPPRPCSAKRRRNGCPGSSRLI